jgi:hypothetical protein
VLLDQGIANEFSPRLRMLKVENSSTAKGKDSGMTLKGKTDETWEVDAKPIQRRVEDPAGNHALNHDDIRRRAYEIYQERGGVPGREVEDWLQAESDLRSAALFMRAATGEKPRP